MISTFFGFGYYVTIPFLAIHAMNVLNKDLSFAGVLLTAQMLGGITGNIAAGFVGDYYGCRRILIISRSMSIILFSLLPFTRTQWHFLILFFIFGAAFFMDRVANMAYPMQISPDDRRPTYVSLITVIMFPAALSASSPMEKRPQGSVHRRRQGAGHIEAGHQRPQDTGQVQALLAYAHAERISVIPRGSGSGMSGQAVPISGGIVLSRVSAAGAGGGAAGKGALTLAILTPGGLTRVPAGGEASDELLDQGRLSRFGFADDGNDGYQGGDHSPTRGD